MKYIWSSALKAQANTDTKLIVGFEGEAIQTS